MIPIAHYENRYKISSNGEILNLANNKLLSPILQKNGYQHVGLADGIGGHKQFTVHRLVALHFIPNPYLHPQINHINGVKIHNNSSNLEWCTAAYNLNHALVTGLRKGYISADQKEQYLHEVLGGTPVPEIAIREDISKESLSKALKLTAKRLGIEEQWVIKMKEYRREAACRNLKKANTTRNTI